MSDLKTMSAAQRAYEEKRARKAGMTLEKWLADKSRARAETLRAAEPPPPPRKPGLISRLLDRAHKPI